MVSYQDRDKRRVEFLKPLSLLILLFISGVMILGTTGIGKLAADDEARIWVGGGDDTITYQGKVEEVTDTEVVMTVEYSVNGYYEGNINNYRGENPVTIQQDKIIATRPWKKDENSSSTPGFSSLLGIIGIFGMAVLLITIRAYHCNKKL